MTPAGADLVGELEEGARRRFVRWDAALWQRVVEGPARALAASLRDDAGAGPVLESYLRLACEGIGLGLPTALAIAQAHGGTIEVRSALGEGSTFTLVVPTSGPDDEP